MRNPRVRLAVFLIVFTTGVVFNLVGIGWLSTLGIALLLLSGEFSSYQKNQPRSSVLIPVLAILVYFSWLGWEASGNLRAPLHLDSWIVFAGIWLLGISYEGWCFWQRNVRTDKTGTKRDRSD